MKVRVVWVGAKRKPTIYQLINTVVVGFVSLYPPYPTEFFIIILKKSSLKFS
jgi:hypothetical protein